MRNPPWPSFQGGKGLKSGGAAALLFSVVVSVSLIAVAARTSVQRGCTHGLAKNRALACLVETYAPAIETVEDPPGKSPVVVLRGGKRLAWDDGRGQKGLEGRLASPDLEDMFADDYLAVPISEAPPKDHDPGRVRVEPLFEAMYGESPAQVRKNLVDVPWAPSGQTVRFNARGGAAEALARVSQRLAKLPARLQKYARRPAGTFNWRIVAGTERLSAHSFGVAIDLAVKKADYWRWSKPVGGVYKYRNRIPEKIAEIFEGQGFIWGGRWYHYDTMHFEYRPELFCACGAP